MSTYYSQSGYAYHAHMDLDMAPCPHIIIHMDMDMTPCLTILHIFAYMDWIWLHLLSFTILVAYTGYGYGSMDITPCPHIIAHMDMDMAPCLHIITDMDLDMAPYPHIIAHMDLDMAPCPHIIAHNGSGYGSMYTYYY